MSRPLGTFPEERERSASERIFGCFFSLLLGSSVLVCASGFYYYGQTVELEIKRIDEQRVEVEMELKQCEFAATVIRKIQAQNKALDEKLKRAYKLAHRKPSVASKLAPLRR